MNKLKTALFLILIIVATSAPLICLFSTSSISFAYAEQISVSDELNEPATSEDADGSLPEDEATTVADNIKAYLQSVYGEDYEKYYNQIIEHWGSVENFLLNASNNLPEEYRYKTNEFLTKINAYIGVGADVILLVFVSFYIIYRAKKNKKINADLETLKAGDNQIETAQLAIMQSQKAQSAALQALMPNVKFESAVAELKKCDKALDSAAEEVKRIV